MIERVRQEQLNSLSIIMAMMSVMGMSTIILCFYEFWATGLHRLLAGASVFIAGCYLMLMLISLRWLFATRLVQNGSRRVVRQFLWLCGTLGTAWGVLIVGLMQQSYGSARTVLYGITIGLISAPTFVTPPSVALAFWIPVSTGGIIAIAMVSTARDLGGTVLLSGYTALTFFCLLYLNRSLIRRVVAEISQSDGRETIDLLLRDFEDSACDWLWETDLHGHLTHVSKRFAEVARVEADELLGAELLSLIEQRTRSPAVELLRRASDQTGLGPLMACRMPFRDVEVALDFDGQQVWWSMSGQPRFSPQNLFDGYRGVGSDITDRKKATDRAEFLAHYDELTGLANRRLFRDVLSAKLIKKDANLALLCLDLDGFKGVNDRHGHPVGDMLLKAVSRRLERQVRDTDFCARLGGDEFAVIVSDLSPELLSVMARRLVIELSKTYVLEDHHLDVGVSIGVAAAPYQDRTPESLLRDADAALYQAKADGRATWRLFDAALSARYHRRRILQRELQSAIELGRLRLEFQPIFEIASGEIVSLEALVRWTRQDGEVVTPTEFVALAEDCGLINDLGDWVLETACRQVESLPRHVKLAVNVSPLQLRSRRLVAQIEQVLASTGFDPHRLELELTESAFLDMSQSTLNLLDEIRAFGIGINLDDFGVGQTSLGQLRRFPFTSLKIDQSFIRDMPDNRASRAIVRGVALMASDLGIKTTAEGIETEEHLELVRLLGCEHAQGFLLSHPCSIEKVMTLLKARSETRMGYSL